MKKILLWILIVSLSFQFTYTANSKNSWEKEDTKKIEKSVQKEEKKLKKAKELKIKEEKIKQKIKAKLEKKLSKYDKLPYEKKVKLYDKLISTINSLLEKNSITKTEKALYTLLKEIILERNNSLNK